MKILIIHGPNLGILEKRKGYGGASLKKINSLIKKKANLLNCKVDIYQSNYEGEIIDLLNEAIGNYDFLIINPGALSHYSLAIKDAIDALDFPAVEVHLTNILAREDSRRKSVTAQATSAFICGMGVNSYLLAVEYAFNFKKEENA